MTRLNAALKALSEPYPRSAATEATVRSLVRRACAADRTRHCGKSSGARPTMFLKCSAKLERDPYTVIDARRVVAKRHEVTVPRVALAWVLAQPGVTSLIVGAKRPEQLVDNLGALDAQLTEADFAAASALPPEYPGWLRADQSYRWPATTG